MGFPAEFLQNRFKIGIQEDEAVYAPVPEQLIRLIDILHRAEHRIVSISGVRGNVSLIPEKRSYVAELTGFGPAADYQVSFWMY